MNKKIQETVQDFIPIKNIRAGIIETVDGRYIKIGMITYARSARVQPVILTAPWSLILAEIPL